MGPRQSEVNKTIRHDADEGHITFSQLAFVPLLLASSSVRVTLPRGSWLHPKVAKYSCTKCLVAGLELGRSESECIAKLLVPRLLFGRACPCRDWLLLSSVLGLRGNLVQQNASLAVMS